MKLPVVKTSCSPTVVVSFSGVVCSITSKNEYPPADVTFRDEIKTHPLVYKWYVMEVVEKKAEEEEEEADLPALSSG